MTPPVKPLSVCFVAGTLGQGGAERQLYYMLRSLSRMDVSTTLISLSAGEFWQSRIEALGVPVYWAGQHRSQGRRLAEIIGHVRRLRPQILQSQHAYVNPYVLVASRAAGARGIGAIRSDLKQELRSGYASLRRVALKHLRMLVPNTINSCKQALQLGVPGERLCIVPNVVDTECFRPVDRVNDRVRIIAVGSLKPEKRFDRFLNLLADLRRKTSTPFEAVLYGSGSLQNSLEKQARALNLTPQILTFAGAQDQMWTAYQQADVLVSCSDVEGMPNVVLEAMSSGLPVAATRVGGVSEVVQHGVNGFVHCPEHEAGLLQSLQSLVEDRDLRLRLGKSARAYVEHNHSLDSLSGVLQTLYQRTLA